MALETSAPFRTRRAIPCRNRSERNQTDEQSPGLELRAIRVMAAMTSAANLCKITRFTRRIFPILDTWPNL